MFLRVLDGIYWKKRTQCDHCAGPIGTRRYADEDYRKLYCSSQCESEGRADCNQRQTLPKPHPLRLIRT